MGIFMDQRFAVEYFEIALVLMEYPFEIVTIPLGEHFLRLIICFFSLMNGLLRLR